ncbi:hypothetical protein RN22_16905 [Grimontia sp. AD028]|uniref:DUF6841 family protein n=1 Tax=Grimontia sp. AD028 TaxID=1581149 RepID=UPI00061B10C6|nr:DUF4440 domain-containing protein [Grimontia sp. AD028]KKD59255.1 hypothetical protein RN22_16905 [Grimontia sp. AD028]
METTVEQAKEFFEHYQTMFDSGDMEAFSKLFAEPFISVRPDGSVQSMPTNKCALKFFSEVYDNWKAEGYSSFRTKDFQVTPIGKDSMLVTFTWVMLDDSQNAIREWRQSYNLLARSSSWVVITSTFHA